MTTPLRVLIVEDSEDDAELLVLELRRAGYEPDALRVETAGEMRAALQQGGWDVVICDYSMPRFSALSAIWELKQCTLDVPCLIVSGKITEAMAVACMRSGAQDYFSKDNLIRLIPALERELRGSAERRGRRDAEHSLLTRDKELRLAREIQQNLLPVTPLELPGFEIGAVNYPAAATSGDYYDWFPMPDGDLAIVVADVSGHGLGPALLMAETRAYLRALAETHSDPGEILCCANRFLTLDTAPSHFVTLFFAKLNAGRRRLVYAAAGHRGLVIDASGAATVLESTGLVLGLDPDAPIVSAPPVRLRSGSLLLLFTDGILETEAPDWTLFGLQRALAVGRDHRAKSARGIADALYSAARLFARTAPQRDDITAVVVKVLPRPRGTGKTRPRGPAAQ